MASWHALHYNAIAKEIREVFPDNNGFMARDERELAMAKRSVLTELSLSLASRFQKDNPNFDPLRFLDACSPNTVIFPLSELWRTSE